MGNELGIKNDRVKIAKVTFAQLIFELGFLSPTFLERIMISDEAYFLLDGGIDTHNSSH